MRVAIVHDWLITLGGSELVLAELLRLYPDAHVFTLLDYFSPENREFVGVRRVSTSFLQRVPGIQRTYRRWLPLYPAAVRSLDVSGYDLVLSNSHAVAKSVTVANGQPHLCYCLSLMRYAWDLREQYLRETRLDRGVTGLVAGAILDGLRRWDRANAERVTAFATLSHYIADRIRRAYNRSATVVYPPVDVEYFTPPPSPSARGDFYVTASRLVPYKRIDLIARAFRLLPDRRLVIVGDGPEAAKIRAAAGPNVELVGHTDRATLRALLRDARAFIFAAEEDFGIAPVEAQACGTPVIAFGRGGVTETVRAAASPVVDGAAIDDLTGVFFDEQSEGAIADAVRRFETLAPSISRQACRRNAERFSAANFREGMRRFVDSELVRHRRRQHV